MERNQITKLVLISLFAALIAAGAFIKIPLVPAPMTLQTLFALLSASCLPPMMAFSSVVVYLFLGVIGLPIFTTGGGLAAMLGPTGGYLIGMIPAVIVGSVIMKIPSKRPRLSSFISAIVSTLIIYLVGLPWLGVKMELSVTATLASGLFPFIVGDIIKIIVTAFVSPVIRPRISEMLLK